MDIGEQTTGIVEENNQSRFALYQLVVDGALLAFICCFGIVGNILFLFILSLKRMKSSFTCYLQHLAVYDLLYLVCRIVFHTVQVLILHRNGASFHLYRAIRRLPSPVTEGVLHSARTGSILTTVGLSFERYIVICHPMKALAFCSFKRTVLFNFVIAIVAVTLNIPRFFLHEVNLRFDNITNETYLTMTKTTFGKSYFFNSVYRWIIIVVVNIFPLFSLLFLNISVYRVVREATKCRHNVTRMQQTDTKLAWTLFFVVIVYFICYTPSFLLLVLYKIGSNVTDYAAGILHLTESINSSVNFIIYAIFSKNFLSTFRHTFCKKWYPRTKTSKSTITLTEVIPQTEEIK